MAFAAPTQGAYQPIIILTAMPTRGAPTARATARLALTPRAPTRGAPTGGRVAPSSGGFALTPRLDRASARKGLALAAAFRPDVLLLDMLMPDVSGFEVAMQVRRQDRLHNCFIIAVTGRADAKLRT